MEEALRSGRFREIPRELLPRVLECLDEPALARRARRFLERCPWRGSLFRLWLQQRVLTEVVDFTLRRARPELRALYLLLSGDVQAYKEVDLDREILIKSYPRLRKRLLAAAREHGLAEFLLRVDIRKRREARVLLEVATPEATFHAALNTSPRLAAILLRGQKTDLDLPPSVAFGDRRPARVLGPPGPPARDLAVSLNGSLVAAAWPDGRTRWWHKAAGQGVLPAAIKGLPARVAVSPDAEWLALAQGRRTRVWRLGGEIREVAGNAALCFEQDHLATSFGQRVYIWKLPELTLAGQLETGQTVQALDFYDDHSILVGHPGEVARWHIELREWMFRQKHSQTVGSLRACPLSQEGWALLGERLETSGGVHGRLDAFTFMPPDRFDTALAQEYGYCWRRFLGIVWRTGRLHFEGDLSRPLPSLPMRSKLARAAFSPDGLTLAAAGEDGRVRIWSVERQLEAEQLNHTGMLDLRLREVPATRLASEWIHSEVTVGPLARRVRRFLAGLLQERYRFALELGEHVTTMSDIRLDP